MYWSICAWGKRRERERQRDVSEEVTHSVTSLHDAVPVHVAVALTWYFSYTTGMENMDTTAGGREGERERERERERKNKITLETAVL